MSPYYDPGIRAEPENQTDVDEYTQLTERDRELLEDLIGDAWCVFSKYSKWWDGEPDIRRERGDHTEEKACLLPGGSPA